MEGDSRNPRVSLLKKYDIPIDHLSFEYIESCKDKKELERIVRILRSGEEGIYPDLIKTAENQLRQIAPDSRVLRVGVPVLRKESFTDEGWKMLEEELMTWEKEMSVMDQGLDFEKKRFDVVGNKNLPDIRKSVDKISDNKSKKVSDVKKIKVETNTKNERIKSGDYAAWEKFDVDKELLKIDLIDERIMEKNAKIKREMEKQKKLAEDKKIEPISIDRDSYTNVEQQILANQAKDRGNECFKAADYTNALKYYNISVNLCPTANAYNNKAMTHIKLKNYEEALNDCNIVLEMEPNNVKALHRRATAYQNLPTAKYNEALQDLLKIISLEPTNRVAQSDLQLLKKKLNVQDIGKKFSMMIEESGNSNCSENRSHWNDIDNTIAVHKLPLTYYGPSTSTFECQPQSMTHRMLSGSSFSGQVMCKCNSNATRQNPLCHNCGERLSRPLQKPKSSLAKRSESEIKKESVSPPLEKPVGNEKISQGDNQSKSNVKMEKSNLITKGDVECEKDVSNEKKNEVEEDGKVGGKEEKEQNTINDLKNSDQQLEVVNVSNKQGGEGDGETESVDINRKLFQELDLSLKERKNQSNEQSRVVTEESLPETVNTGNDQIDLSESLPNGSSQSGKKCESKKRGKKKREQRQDGIQLRYPEQVKIVQATKYLKPTSAEPKPENSRTESSSGGEKERKEEELGDSKDVKCQFKSFAGRKNAESGILKSSGTIFPHSRNSNERDSRISSCSCGTTSRERKGKHSQGNKENIIDGNTFENHRNKNKNISNNNNHFEDGDCSGTGYKSGFEFIKSWEAVKNFDDSYEKRAEIMRVMRPEDLKRVIGENLDSEMLTSLLECLERHFLENDPKMVTGVLKELPRIPRFSLVILFLNQNERKVIERLIEKTEKKGFVLEEEVKSSLKLSF